MKKICFYFQLFILFNCSIKNIYIKNKEKIIKNEELNGIYKINFILNNSFFWVNKDELILSDKCSYFNIIKIELNSYLIINRKNKKILSINKKDEIKLYDKKDIIDQYKIIWNIFKINECQYIIQNRFNKKFIGVSNNNKLFLNFLNQNIIIDKRFFFNFIKLFEEGYLKKNFLKIINKEPIDIIIKYIDITDKKLNKVGISYIYKDQDNEELRYSIRSILQNIPWVRKIYILMPNDKVRFLKSIDEIKEKIIYVKDKELLGYDSANNCAFSFNLFKMEKFGVSKNFIYMDDDYFYGKPLKKSDFFYFDEKERRVSPFILTYKFLEINKTHVFEQYNEMFEQRDIIHPHSGKGFTLSLLCTEKLFIENFNITLIRTEHTHNAISQNLDSLKELFELIRKYEYFNETMQSKERFILRLSQQHCFNLYQLNIKKRKVHSIPYKYIKMESINKEKFDKPLFVINTGGNHIPLSRQYKIQKKVMEKIFPYPTKFEIYKKKSNNKYIINCLYILYINIIVIFIKLFILLVEIKNLS